MVGVRAGIRNHEWRHLVAEDVISMPDKWEYPWFAAWDLAFHAVALALADVGLAKQQLQLLLDRRYLHPNGQLSAYEWNFSDVNPPVHAWATFFVYEIDKARSGRGDRLFLEHSFQKMMKNFVWWLNRKDLDGRNIFQGGFLGLDNIGLFDRSAPLPTGGHLDQADGTAWMALCIENMMQICLELSREDSVYLGYLPAESDTGMFGGNSNWRGPVWFPTNIILLQALLNIYAYLGDSFTVECPTGSGRYMNLLQVAREISNRLTGIFLRGPDGRRPVHGGQATLQSDPYWRDLLLFYEYFHGDNGAGIGASHQTGWTGTVALLPLLTLAFSSEGIAAGGMGQLIGMASPRRRSAGAMSGWPRQPVIYEINTAVWLNERSRAAGRRLTLADLEPNDWDAITPAGIDAVWLMGVWERSPSGLAVANDNNELQASFRDALPDLRPGDVIGSPYCVRRYVVDAGLRRPPRPGPGSGRAGQQRRAPDARLRPNHVAPDHPWTMEHPERFIQGDA